MIKSNVSLAWHPLAPQVSAVIAGLAAVLTAAQTYSFSAQWWTASLRKVRRCPTLVYLSVVFIPFIISHVFVLLQSVRTRMSPAGRLISSRKRRIQRTDESLTRMRCFIRRHGPGTYRSWQRRSHTVQMSTLPVRRTKARVH